MSAIRLEIVASSFEEMIRELGGAARLFVAIPQSPNIPAEVAAEVKADLAEPPVEAEEVKPPRKPRNTKKPPETIEAVANKSEIQSGASPATAGDGTAGTEAGQGPNAATPSPAPEAPVEAPKPPDAEEIRKKVIAFMHATAPTPDEKRVAFDALRDKIGVKGPVSEWPVEKYPAALAYLAEKIAAL